MSNTSIEPNTIAIRHRHSGAVLYSSTAATVTAAVAEAIGTGSDLSGSDLSDSDLSYSDLSGSNLRGSNLRGSNLHSANLHSANLHSANLRYLDLRGSNLRGSNLSDSDLRGSNLRGTICLSVTGLPSGHAILTPLPDGWQLTIGCWTGTVDALRDLIAQDIGWPEATGPEITKRRPMLAALADMCDAWSATQQDTLDEIVQRWAVTA